MQTYEMLVRNRAVTGNSTDMTLVRTSVGIDMVHILFDNPLWLEFPVTITFAQGDVIVSQPVVLSGISESEWAAETSCIVPREVINMTGSIRVTLQGTDADSRHIITAKGSPLSVEESGDVEYGTPPSDAPTIDQWSQAYALAMSAANHAETVANNIGGEIESMVYDAIDSRIGSLTHSATIDSLGMIKVGNGLTVSDDGTLSVSGKMSLSSEQVIALENLMRLANACFDIALNDDGVIGDNTKVKPSALPLATNGSPGAIIPDGTTITIDDNGMIYGEFITHSWDGSVLTVFSQSGPSSADLMGPPMTITDVTSSIDGSTGSPSVTVTVGGTSFERTFDFAFSGLKGEKGEKGDRGDDGSPGYMLTQSDIDTISSRIAEMYDLAENERF